VLEQIRNDIEEANKTSNNDGEPPSKRSKREKNKGQNKNRPVFREAFDDKLCRALVNGDGKCEREICKFLHDIPAYFEKKPPDLGDKCPIYSTKGFCIYGIACRFGAEHITEDFKNMNMEKKPKQETDRSIPYEVQVALRKKTYDFSTSDGILRDTEALRDKLRKGESCEDDDEKVVLRPAEKKKVDFRNKLVLSPLTTVGNLPFRRICKEYGADITVGEMACSQPLVSGAMSEWALTKRHSSEDVFGVQIEGNNSKMITYAAQLLSEVADIDFVDLNVGCPIELIFRHGGGSALMRRQNVLESVVRSCSTLLKDKPFTVKIRTGISPNHLVAKDLLPKLEKWGASAVTLHGRTKEQRYSKLADWNYIEECASGMKDIPVIGNGDIFSFQEYQAIKENYKHVSSVMIGRGALIKPWIFKVSFKIYFHYHKLLFIKIVGDKRGEGLRHQQPGATRDGQEVCELRTRALGQRHERRGNNSQIPSRVALVPLSIRSARTHPSSTAENKPAP
jgi:tRNA-dihydrouridine synthase 3